LKTCAEAGLHALQFRASPNMTTVNASLAFGAQPAPAGSPATTNAATPAAGSEPAAPHGRRRHGHH